MSTLGRGHLAGLAGMLAAVLLSASVWAETKPPTTPAGRDAPPKSIKFNDYEPRIGTKARGKGFYSLPEVGDEVLLKSRKGGR